MPVPLIRTQQTSQLLVKQIEHVQALVFSSAAPYAPANAPAARLPLVFFPDSGVMCSWGRACPPWMQNTQFNVLQCK